MTKSALACCICHAPLSGRQRKYCSRTCKNKDTNHHHQSYAAQQARGLKRKLELMAEHGTRCARCGYDRNFAALMWHHRDRKSKSFEMDMRSLSNRSAREVGAEARKCVLLCANCRAEEHYPQFVNRAARKRRAPRQRGS